ncbi:mediator of RNA polymerase II transcription subunit 15 [Condylostylus longicornis]|uniref:mediator of RNA polymerase II transcription subunit 15 n=1 Tax=Condylostylus longicornis TaxID=2530218 RepID=UPI00244E013F|nr:mediator of RNA polymerase II transcription subunit 15 [Condylostylus longicornis]
MTDEWQTQKFRQSVVAKINELIPKSTIMDPCNGDATVMENHIFKKAKNREEYLSLLAKLFIHYREINKGRQQAGNAQVPNDMGASTNNVVQEPLNALQNLAMQGSRNPQLVQQMNQGQNPMGGNSMVGTASNLLQTLTQPRQNAQNQNVSAMRGQMLNAPMNVGAMNNNLSNFNPSIGMNNMVVNSNSQGQAIGGNIMPNQVQMPNMPQNQSMNMQNNMPNQMTMGMNHTQLNQMINRMNNQGLGQNQMPQNIGNMNQLEGPNIMNSAQGMSQAIQRPAGQTMINNSNPAMFQGNRPVGQYLRQSPSPTVSSPAAAAINTPQQMQSNSQMIPSPALVPTSSPQMANILATQRNLRQSPSGPLNTPGQITNSSPFNPQEDQLYREKYKQLTKYIEPLKRMVAKIGNDDVEKITKMNKLLEILCNPQQRIPLETLLKCEKALEKMDFKSYPMQVGYQFGSNNALLEAVNSTLQNSIGNHTLQRTFRPCLEALFGSDIKSFPSSKQYSGKLKENNITTSEIPHVLQGEIARLDQKFKLSLDSSCQSHSKIIKLICCIDDTKLPCVPPLLVSIPEEYPMVSPSCSLTNHEYPATPFLLAVQNTLVTRISKLPKVYSLSHLLDTWEMSIRHACTPKNLASIENVYCI